MNIRDLGPLGDPLGRNREVSGRDRAESTEKTAGTAENGRTAPSKAEDARETAPRDVFRTSNDRRKIEELAQTVEQTGDEPRAERVELARQRAASGYYNSEEFLGSLALRLVNPGTKG